MKASIVLAGRNNVHSWWLGVLGCSMFATLFYSVNLYADVALQVFFIVTCALGWMLAVGLAATLCYGMMLQAYTKAYAPFVDSSVLAFSIVAQLLLMGRRLENWPFWLLVNTICVPLYASRGLYLTSLLYAAYWVNALVSWVFWRRRMRLEGSAAAPL